MKFPFSAKPDPIKAINNLQKRINHIPDEVDKRLDEREKKKQQQETWNSMSPRMKSKVLKHVLEKRGKK